MFFIFLICRARQSIAVAPQSTATASESVDAELAGLVSRQGGGPMARLPTAQASAVKNEADELLQVNAECDGGRARALPRSTAVVFCALDPCVQAYADVLGDSKVEESL
jgi:hypothetical protein